ncbi:MAG: hypothetical protein WKG07_35495 [Hymenobacter sp.]
MAAALVGSSLAHRPAPGPTPPRARRGPGAGGGGTVHVGGLLVVPGRR